MDMKFEKHCWAEIDLDALRHNFAYIRQAVGGPVCAVVKADAYGHGDVATAKAIQQALATMPPSIAPTPTAESTPAA